MAVLRSENRLGAVKAISAATYTIVGSAVAANHVWSGILVITTMGTVQVKVRAYVADNSWSSGVPTAGTLVSTICVDLILDPGQIVRIPRVLLAAEKLVVYCDTASGADFAFEGTDRNDAA